MKQLIIARNVINTEEIDAFLNEIELRYELTKLDNWMEGPLRKWIIKKAPAQVADLAVVPGMPDWLQRSLQNGEQLWAIQLEELREIISPVIDFMADMITRKDAVEVAAGRDPLMDTSHMQIGFEAAQARSAKWHDLMAKQAANRAKKGNAEVAIDEPGTEIIKHYANGYTWRSVKTKPALEREGDVMGHCVGRFGYFEQVARAKVSIMSLRDEMNQPHVTIEIRDTEIHQIKGKANKAVLPKYLFYVEDFLKSRTWSYVHFDQVAPEVKTAVIKHHFKTASALFSWGQLSLISAIGVRRGDAYQILDNEKNNLGGILANIDKQEILDLQISKDHPSLPEFIARLIIEKSLMYPSSQFGIGPGSDSDIRSKVFSKSVWKNERVIPGSIVSDNEVWKSPDNVFAKAECVANIGGIPTSAFWQNNRLSGFTMKAEFFFTESLFGSKTNISTVVLSEGTTNVAQLYSYGYNFRQAGLKARPEVLGNIRRLLAGKQMVNTKSNKELLETLLTALKQPNTTELLQAAQNLEKYEDPRDQDFKSKNITTGGRSLNAISMLLVASLVRKNLQGFQQFVFNKPNAVTCFCEVLTQPDHVSHALKAYDIDDEVIINIVLVLRNEFLRLLPTTDQLDALEIESGFKTKIRSALKQVHQKNNKAQSKEIWTTGN